LFYGDWRSIAPDPANNIITFSQFLNTVELVDTYLIIGAVNFPMGEIRGQILPVSSIPEPPALGIFVIACAGLAAARWTPVFDFSYSCYPDPRAPACSGSGRNQED
jgi:hypothetical protein